MAEASRLKAGLSPAKLGLIIVLSLVLLAVIGSQMFGGNKPARSAAQRRPRHTENASVDSAPPAQTASPAPASGSEPAWPLFTVQQAAAYNPFALPQSLQPPLPSPATALESVEPATSLRAPDVREMRRRQAELMATFREQGVDMILTTPEGVVARIGQHSLRVGDVVEGLRVSEINAGGIVFVEEMASDPAADNRRQP